jgi:hypothetical protein
MFIQYYIVFWDLPLCSLVKFLDLLVKRRPPIDIYKTIRCHTPEDSILHSNLHGNCKFYLSHKRRYFPRRSNFRPSSRYTRVGWALPLHSRRPDNHILLMGLLDFIIFPSLCRYIVRYNAKSTINQFHIGLSLGVMKHFGSLYMLACVYWSGVLVGSWTSSERGGGGGANRSSQQNL